MFSILIPTKNRADLLRMAVQSLLEQTFGDYEVVVSDNNSSNDTRSVIASLGDQRIKYTRSEHDLSATANWNNCFRLSTGRYIMMIGDDDYLLPECLEILHSLITSYEQPNIVQAGAALYSPPDRFERYWRNTVNVPLSRGGESHRVISARALEAIFSFHFPFETQSVCYSRALLEVVAQGRDGPYAEAYPDHFCAIAALLHAKEYISTRKPVIILGRGPRGLGAMALSSPSDAEEVWRQHVDPENKIDICTPIPGPHFKNGNYITLMHIKHAYPKMATPYTIDLGAYYSVLYTDLVSYRVGNDHANLRAASRSMMKKIPRRYKLQVHRHRIVSTLREAIKQAIPYPLLNSIKRFDLAHGNALFVRLPNRVTNIQECYSYCKSIGIL